jgi:hypothetical protein
MKLATIFITSGREDKSEQTLTSFAKYNGWGAHAPYDTIWLHGDDASETRRNKELANSFGYKTVVSTSEKKRLGAHAMRRKMIDEALDRGATHIFILENDWESVREMPWTAIRMAFELEDQAVWAMRLYHTQKQRDGTRPTGAVHAGRNNADPGWRPLQLAHTACEIGDIHFGAPPCVFEAHQLRWLHDRTVSESASMRKSGQIVMKTVRVVENVFWHIGYERTPGFHR